MSTLASTPEDIDRLISHLVEGSISSTDMQVLDELICTRPEVRQRYYGLMHTHTCLNWRLSGWAHCNTQDVRESGLILEVIEQQTVLADEERQADLDWITQYESENYKEAQAKASGDINKDAITAGQLVSLAGYLLGQALTSKPAYKVYGVAAAILVAVTLFLVYSGGDDNTVSDPLAGQTSTPDVQIDPPSVPALSVVATLTQEHDAVWDRQPGGDLYANQRLTLTAGFAEITTTRGAVAILEAPATIELIDHDNALRLHAGKLVGICETESSKGFLVRTLQMDITDLGTRFGVDTTTTGGTEVHVLQGQVEVTHALAGQTRTLGTGQSAAAIPQSRGLSDTPFSTARFAAVRRDGSLNRFVLTGEVPDSLDLVDLIAGGDGRGDREHIGLNPATGRLVRADHESVWQNHPADGRFTPAADAPFVAGTFVPGADGIVTQAPTGLALPVIPGNQKRSYGVIWCGGDYPRNGNMPGPALSELDSTHPNTRAMVLHASTGVTIDLQAIRAAYPNHRVIRFVATVNNIVTPQKIRKSVRSHITIGVDDAAAIDHAFLVTRDAPSKPLAIDLPIETAQHLTLASTDGGDDTMMDWIVFMNPRLILEPVNH